MLFETASSRPAGAKNSNRSMQSLRTAPGPGANPVIGNRQPITRGTSDRRMGSQNQQPITGKTSNGQPGTPLSTPVPPPGSSQPIPAAGQNNSVQGWPAQRQTIKKLKRQIINSLKRRFGNTLPPQVLQQIVRQVIKARLGSRRQQMTTGSNASKQ